LKEVLGYSDIPQTTAMREGLEKEDEIAQILISEMKQQGCGVSVENCGFLSAHLMVLFGRPQAE